MVHSVLVISEQIVRLTLGHNEILRNRDSTSEYKVADPISMRATP